MHANGEESDCPQPGTSGSQGRSSKKQPLHRLESGIGNDFNQSAPSNAGQVIQQSSHKNKLGGEGVRRALHGILYQLKLSILFLQTALDEKYSFELYSEKKDAEKFDDVVFKFCRDEQYRFLQAKHKLNPEKDKITIGKLLSEDPKEPFNLQKYFISFRRIKQKLYYKEKIKDLTICTNADFSNHIKKEIKEGRVRLTNKDERDDILDICGGKRYKFIFDRNKDIVERLKDASDLNRLARKLAKAVWGERIILNLKDELFKAYHIPLINEVFDKKKVQSSEAKKWYCEFKRDFKENNNLSKEAELFRMTFEEEAWKIVKNIDSNILWNIASEKKIDASSGFGEHTKLTDGKLKLVSDEEGKQSLPNDSVIVDEIKEFFEKLIFAVEQPNEEELGKFIKDKIFNDLDDLKDDVMAELIENYVEKQMLDWLKKPKSTALLKRDDFFSEGAEKVKKIMLYIPNEEYRNFINEKCINFNNESEELQKLRKFLDSDIKILNLVSSEKNIILSQTKVYQIKPQPAWQLRNLLSQQKFAGNKKRDVFQDNLLVIICKNESQIKRKDIEGLYNELTDSIKDNGKKVVLITLGDSILASLFEEGCLKNKYEKRPDNTGISDLDPDYLQNNLLKKTILFQGQAKSLVYLIGIEDKKPSNDGLSEEEMHKLDEVLKCEALCEFIVDEDIVVGDKLPDFRDSSSPYYDPYYIDIPREFDYQIMDEDSLKNCLQDREKDKFAISAIKENYLNDLVPQGEKGKIKKYGEKGYEKGRFIFSENPEENFKDLANSYSSEGFHWITKIDNKFVLKHSSRLFDLRKFGIKDPKKKMKDLTDSTVIIAGDPGIGKSTVLTTCFYVLDSFSWFIRVDLKDHQMHIENAKFEDFEGILKFFSEITAGLETTLAISLLRYRLKHQGQVVLLFDGYDEINNRNQEKLIRLLKTLKRTKGKVWLTTRLSKQLEVENALGIFAYFLNPLDKEQQKEFLKQFWISKLNVKNSNQEEENRIDVFSEKLLEYFSGLDLMKEGNLVGIVLQARMVARIFEDECRKYIKSERLNPFEFEINNIFDMYERFVDDQYGRYFTEKIKIGRELLGKGSRNALTESYTKAHECLALTTLFSEDRTCKEFLRDQTYQVFLQDELSGMGLIKSFKDTDIVHFVHRSYAEYFMAKLLVRKLSKREDDPEFKLIREFLLRNIFFNRNELMFVFFEHGIQKKCDEDLSNKWKAIQNCDLLREIRTIGSLQLFNPSPESAMSEKSLSELKKAVDSCINWPKSSPRYYYNGDVTLIRKLFQKFCKETDIKELEVTLEFLVKFYKKSFYFPADNEFSCHNMYNAVKHYLAQAKLQNKLNHKFMKDMLSKEVGDTKCIKQKLTTNIKELFPWGPLLMESPFVAEIIQYIETLYSNKGYQWLEDKGTCIARHFMILTPKMAEQFCSILDEPINYGRITGYDRIYASNILNYFIHPVIDMMQEGQLSYVHKLSFIKMLARFTHFVLKHNTLLVNKVNKSYSFNSSQLETVLKLIETLVSEQVFVYVSESAKYLFILGEAGLKLIDTGQELLLLDPASEFRYALSSSKDLIVELIEWKSKNPRDNFIRALEEVLIKPQIRKRRVSMDENDLQALTKKRCII
ncbi:NACHT domain-containing protein [Nephila pilipes]|uniref:NACHT domain-containing protein n=1 Tax=Nephila pilipes TaxID=299642 RepID=A0A8X6U7V1_NEPPI|nr:NACHT domain-containing protein [Nephila pilipes]